MKKLNSVDKAINIDIGNSTVPIFSNFLGNLELKIENISANEIRTDLIQSFFAPHKNIKKKFIQLNKEIFTFLVKDIYNSSIELKNSLCENSSTAVVCLKLDNCKILVKFLNLNDESNLNLQIFLEIKSDLVLQNCAIYDATSNTFYCTKDTSSDWLHDLFNIKLLHFKVTILDSKEISQNIKILGRDKNRDNDNDFLSFLIGLIMMEILASSIARADIVDSKISDSEEVLDLKLKNSFKTDLNNEILSKSDILLQVDKLSNLRGIDVQKELRDLLKPYECNEKREGFLDFTFAFKQNNKELKFNSKVESFFYSPITKSDMDANDSLKPITQGYHSKLSIDFDASKFAADIDGISKNIISEFGEYKNNDYFVNFNETKSLVPIAHQEISLIIEGIYVITKEPIPIAHQEISSVEETFYYETLKSIEPQFIEQISTNIFVTTNIQPITIEQKIDTWTLNIMPTFAIDPLLIEKHEKAHAITIEKHFPIAYQEMSSIEETVATTKELDINIREQAKNDISFDKISFDSYDGDGGDNNAGYLGDDENDVKNELKSSARYDHKDLESSHDNQKQDKVNDLKISTIINDDENYFKIDDYDHGLKTPVRNDKNSNSCSTNVTDRKNFNSGSTNATTRKDSNSCSTNATTRKNSNSCSTNATTRKNSNPSTLIRKDSNSSNNDSDSEDKNKNDQGFPAKNLSSIFEAPKALEESINSSVILNASSDLTNSKEEKDNFNISSEEKVEEKFAIENKEIVKILEECSFKKSSPLNQLVYGINYSFTKAETLKPKSEVDKIDIEKHISNSDESCDQIIFENKNTDIIKNSSTINAGSLNIFINKNIKFTSNNVASNELVRYENSPISLPYKTKNNEYSGNIQKFGASGFNKYSGITEIGGRSSKLIKQTFKSATFKNTNNIFANLLKPGDKIIFNSVEGEISIQPKLSTEGEMFIIKIGELPENIKKSLLSLVKSIKLPENIKKSLLSFMKNNKLGKETLSLEEYSKNSLMKNKAPGQETLELEKHSNNSLKALSNIALEWIKKDSKSHGGYSITFDNNKSNGGYAMPNAENDSTSRVYTIKLIEKNKAIEHKSEVHYKTENYKAIEYKPLQSDINSSVSSTTNLPISQALELTDVDNKKSLNFHTNKPANKTLEIGALTHKEISELISDIDNKKHNVSLYGQLEINESKNIQSKNISDLKPIKSNPNLDNLPKKSDTVPSPEETKVLKLYDQFQFEYSKEYGRTLSREEIEKIIPNIKCIQGKYNEKTFQIFELKCTSQNLNRAILLYKYINISNNLILKIIYELVVKKLCEKDIEILKVCNVLNDMDCSKEKKVVDNSLILDSHIIEPYSIRLIDDEFARLNNNHIARNEFINESIDIEEQILERKNKALKEKEELIIFRFKTELSKEFSNLNEIPDIDSTEIEFKNNDFVIRREKHEEEANLNKALILISTKVKTNTRCIISEKPKNRFDGPQIWKTVNAIKKNTSDKQKICKALNNTADLKDFVKAPFSSLKSIIEKTTNHIKAEDKAMSIHIKAEDKAMLIFKACANQSIYKYSIGFSDLQKSFISKNQKYYSYLEKMNKNLNVNKKELNKKEKFNQETILPLINKMKIHQKVITDEQNKKELWLNSFNSTSKKITTSEKIKKAKNAIFDIKKNIINILEEEKKCKENICLEQNKIEDLEHKLSLACEIYCKLSAVKSHAPNLTNRAFVDKEVFNLFLEKMIPDNSNDYADMIHIALKPEYEMRCNIEENKYLDDDSYEGFDAIYGELLSYDSEYNAE